MMSKIPFVVLIGLLCFTSTRSLVTEKRQSASPPSTRRNLLDTLSTAGVTLLASSTITAAVTRQSASAACLPGDLSPECIGVYKVPMDDKISGMVGTKEALERNAPGLNYVPPIEVPKSIKDAMQVLEAQRRAADDIKTVISGGRLEEAGIKVLNLLPKVTAAGRVIIQNVEQTSTLSAGAKEVQLLKLQSKFDETLGCFGQVDVSIGQGLRGQMGVVTVAQLGILSDLKEAIGAFDEFLEQIPSSIKK